ncbi:MAG: hypothetical protein C4542_02555 [Dehalococcoidia bacterium]|nr:MAG: hypothetical protein C4542_02555 [Dehalococcoidia bacterium]
MRGKATFITKLRSWPEQHRLSETENSTPDKEKVEGCLSRFGEEREVGFKLRHGIRIDGVLGATEGENMKCFIVHNGYIFYPI